LTGTDAITSEAVVGAAPTEAWNAVASPDANPVP
jgi:hypothetical protein